MTPLTDPKTRYTFLNWAFAGTTSNQVPLTVTASPSVPEYRALFNVEYALTLGFFDCSGVVNCAASSPGTILVNNAPNNSSGDFYFTPGALVTLVAIPNPGYIFAGWTGGTPNGFTDTVTLNQPTTVYPRFHVARRINFTTVPDGLQLLADGTPVYSGATLDWGWDSVGPVSPQQDTHNKYWVFQSWSDGGAPNGRRVQHAPIPSRPPIFYIPAVPVTLLTQPLGLKLKIDGALTNVLNLNYFTWGINETHHVEAPAQQTDPQGNLAIPVLDQWRHRGPGHHRPARRRCHRRNQTYRHLHVTH
jgi:hypothetical protein